MNVKGNRLTVDNIFNLQPTLIPMPQGTNIGVIDPNDGNKIRLSFVGFSLNDVTAGNTLNTSAGFMGLEDATSFLITEVDKANSSITIDDARLHTAVGKIKSTFSTTNTSTFTVGATPDNPVSLSAFATPEELYLLLPNHNDQVADSQGDFKTLDDVLATGFVGVAFASDTHNRASSLFPSYVTGTNNRQVIAGKRLFTPGQTFNVTNEFATTRPAILAGVESILAPEATSDYRWVKFSRSILGGDSITDNSKGYINNYGFLLVDQPDQVTSATLNTYGRNFISTVTWNLFGKYRGVGTSVTSSIIVGEAQRNDVIAVPPNYFTERQLINSRGELLNRETITGIPPHLGLIFETAKEDPDFEASTEYTRFGYVLPRELFQSVVSRVYKGIRRVADDTPSDPLIILRPNFTVELTQAIGLTNTGICLLYTSPSPRDRQKSRMPSSA